MFVRGEWGSGVAPALYLIVFGKIFLWKSACLFIDNFPKRLDSDLLAYQLYTVSPCP